MKNIFDSVTYRKPKTSVFDLSHERKQSMKMGDLTPMYLQEVVPGDKFNVNSEVFVRLAPMIAPIMHRVDVYTHYFFVPNRLVYSDWQKFITMGDKGQDTPVFPMMSCGSSQASYFGKGTLADYMGLPIELETLMATQTFGLNALPFRAYQLIYNEYYRDQNLIDEVEFNKSGIVDAADYAQLLTMRKRAWGKDYFTSALPYPQKGSSAGIPLDLTYKDPAKLYAEGTSNYAQVDINNITAGEMQDDNGDAIRVENIDTDSTRVDVNELRTALRLQEWLEKNARAGSRYIESILAHFGVRSSDARLQRPEYLGGGRQNVVISEVLNHSATATEPQGGMAGHGMSVGKTNGFGRSFEEHGFVIGIMSVLPKTAYQQGIHKLWKRQDVLDYYFPAFANLGEQAIENREIYVTGTSGDSETFGYTERYAEMKFNADTVHGDFRDNLDFWHLGRKFASKPSLNQSFVEANPSDRIWAVQDGTDQLWVEIYNRVKAVRPMPYHAIPSIF